jgi:DnaK suppressor protein
MPRSSRSAADPRKKKSAAKAASARGRATGTARKATKATATRAGAAKAAPSRTAAKTGRATRAAKPAKPTKPAKGTKAAKATKVAKATKTSKTSKATAAILDRFLEGQRKALLEERATYTRHATDLRAEAEQLAADREPGDVQFDEESGQGDTMNVERERDLALSAQALAAVEDIDRALAKMDAGTYGVCERCGHPIPKERLRALPYAALCVACKSGGLTTRR